MDTTLTTGTDEAAVALAVGLHDTAAFVDDIADGDHWPDSEWCRTHEGEWAAALLAALRADPAAARAVRDAIDPDGLRVALRDAYDTMDAATQWAARQSVGTTIEEATGHIRGYDALLDGAVRAGKTLGLLRDPFDPARLEGTPDAD